MQWVDLVEERSGDCSVSLETGVLDVLKATSKHKTWDPDNLAVLITYSPRAPRARSLQGGSRTN